MSREISERYTFERAKAYRLAELSGWPARGLGEQGSFFELQKMANGMPCVYTTMNANAAITTRTDSVNAAIGGASGFVLRLWDGGKPRTTHREYGGRVIWADTDPSAIAGHATHVAGTMLAAGVFPSAKGMAYASTIRAFDWNNDAAEMTSEASAGANISSHSYGYIAGWYYNSSNGYWYWYGDTAVSEVEDYHFGFYDSDAQLFDNLAMSAPYYLIVVAASNDRDDTGPPAGTKHYYWDSRYNNWRFSTKTRNADGTPLGYDCIPFGFQISKNTLTVGAVDDVLNYTGPSSVTLAAFSSTGPCDDGRIKPDIVGNGLGLISSYSTSDSSYTSASGTSMAAPNVSGSLGLLADYYRDTHGGSPMRSATLKALAIHTAREAGAAPGPDYQFGWGLLDAYAAYRHLLADYLVDSKGLIEELTLSNGQTLEYAYRVSGATPELRVTICWTDPPGTSPSPSVDPSARMLVNDLDLRIVKGSETYMPWKLDKYNPSNPATRGDNNIDNVEQVVVTSPTEGVYIVRITHKGSLYAGSQQFSMIVSGAERNRIWHIYEDGSGDAATIATAISIAYDGDSLFVHPGVYREANISVEKALTIAGTDGAANTILDGEGLGAGILIFPPSTKTIAVEGITMRKGSTSASGGGMRIQNSNVSVKGCVFDSCYANYSGGGLAIISSSPSISNCTFIDNSARLDGGGLYLYSSSSVMESCVFFYNRSTTRSGGGVALLDASASFVNCTISDNEAGSGGYGGNIFVGNAANVSLTRCIVAFALSGGGIYGEETAAGASVECCNVYGNEGGNYAGSIPDKTGIDDNISVDPLFCDREASVPDLSISTLSLCAAENSPCGELIGALGIGCTISSVDEISHAFPRVTSLEAIRPNPFNPSAGIAFSLAERAKVRIEIFDVSGRRVATVLDEELDPGRYEARWDGLTYTGSRAGSGIYFCRMQAGGVTATKKMVLLR